MRKLLTCCQLPVLAAISLAPLAAVGQAPVVEFTSPAPVVVTTADGRARLASDRIADLRAESRSIADLRVARAKPDYLGTNSDLQTTREPEAAPSSGSTLPRLDLGCASPNSGCASPALSCGCGDCALDAGSSDCGCVGPCVGACRRDPALVVYADHLLLYRHRVDPVELARGQANPNEVYNAGDHQFDWSSGVQFGVVGLVRPNVAVGGRYMHIDSLRGDHRMPFVADPAFPLRINSDPPVFAPNVEGIQSELSTRLQSLELDTRLKLCSYCWLGAGFRYLELSEGLRMDLDAGAQAFSVDTDTSNHLYGFQLAGISSLPLSRRLRLDVDVKGGLYNADRRQISSVDSDPGFVPARGQSDGSAFVGEVQAALVAALTPGLSLRAGYDLMWVESVALASEQVPASDFFAGTGIDDDGSLMLHGFLLGLELRR